jgi:hypothetical protein
MKKGRKAARTEGMIGLFFKWRYKRTERKNKGRKGRRADGQREGRKGWSKKKVG